MATDFSEPESNEEIEFDDLIDSNKKISSGENLESFGRKPEIQEDHLNIIDKVINKKWYTLIRIVEREEYSFQSLALIDSGADLNCINEGLVPTKYFDKATQILNTADGSKLKINYKLSNAVVCNNGDCFQTPYIMVKGLSQAVILGTPFLTLLYPLKIDNTGIQTEINGHQVKFNFIDKPKIKKIHNVKQSIENKKNFLWQLKVEIKYKIIDDNLALPEIKEKIDQIKKQIEQEVCSELPNAFWDRKKHIITLPYEEEFTENKIPTKARPIQLNSRLLEICKKEIDELLKKKLIRESSSPWSCAAFYVEKNTEKKRRVPRLVINYKPLNKVLKWFRYSIPNKKDLLDRLLNACIFSKVYLKSRYWQIQINEKDKYKTTFNVSFGQYEWNIMPFGLKNAPFEFQKIMKDVFNPYIKFMIVYIDDVLILS
ncbi:hypothetical protein AMTRI_Chr08g164330 [Amborella trichopoda]